MFKDKRSGAEKQEKSKMLEEKLVKMLWPVLVELDQKMDRRLVMTFLGVLMAILRHRHRNQGLVLSELGGYLLEPEHCQAGTKRISTLLHSDKWEADLLEDYLWQQATRRVEEIGAHGERALVIWDESVLEKPESLQAEGLCAVRSSQAVRLKRIKPGYYNPPGGRPIFVPGFHWLQVLVSGHQGPPTLAHMRWWTTRREQASQMRTEEAQVLDRIDRDIGAVFQHRIQNDLSWNKHIPFFKLLGQLADSFNRQIDNDVYILSCSRLTPRPLSDRASNEILDTSSIQRF